MSLPLSLAATLDTAAAGPLRQALRQAIERGAPVTLDGSGVERVGQACLQVLVAARAAAGERGVAFAIADPSPALDGMAALAGLSPLVHA
jgi:chemotaxis protein CheX